MKNKLALAEVIAWYHPEKSTTSMATSVTSDGNGRSKNAGAGIQTPDASE